MDKLYFREFEIVPAYEHAEQIAELFSEYTQMLMDNDHDFAGYLELQKYDDELADLKYKYGEPDGRIYIAYLGGRSAGCVGMKRQDERSCELKRLYVRPEYRGRGLARYLSELILSEAKKAGYERVLLDTLPFLGEAQALYKSLGFYEIPKYLKSPMEDAIYMRYDL